MYLEAIDLLNRLLSMIRGIMSNFKLVPELYCTDIEVTKNFYVDIFGFEIKYERIDDRFAYFILDDVRIMAEEIADGRRWLTGKMKRPFGRGINFQWDVAEIEKLYTRIKSKAPDSIYLKIETISYQCADLVVIKRQFIAQDPDGYLFRFCSDVTNASS